MRPSDAKLGKQKVSSNWLSNLHIHPPPSGFGAQTGVDRRRWVKALSPMKTYPGRLSGRVSRNTHRNKDGALRTSIFPGKRSSFDTELNSRCLFFCVSYENARIDGVECVVDDGPVVVSD